MTQVSVGATNGNGAFGVIFNGSSSDGTVLFFSTSEKLTADDSDSTIDIFQRSGGATTRVSQGQINGNSGTAAVFRGASSDGSRVVFDTTEKLVAGDGDTAVDLYMRAAGTTSLVSAGAINGNANQPAQFQAMSSDGTRVFFSSIEQLAAEDGDTTSDIYERVGGATSLISPGDNNTNGTSFSLATPNGLAVFFITRDKIVVSDIDTALDVYGAYSLQ